MTTPQYAIAIATCVLLVVAVFTDVRGSKIPNALTVPFAVLGLLLNLWAQGPYGILVSLGGLVLGLALFFVSALLGRILGAGDCKLFAAVGALLGPQLLIWGILYTALAGGVFALLIALWRGVLGRSVKAVGQAVYFRLTMKMPMDITTADAKMRLPYAVAICAGCLFVLWQQYGVG
jgi:prepilin peptidase CpaA